VGPHFYIKSLRPLNEQLGYHPCFSVRFIWTWKNFVAPEAASWCDFQITSGFILLEPSELAQSSTVSRSLVPFPPMLRSFITVIVLFLKQGIIIGFFHLHCKYTDVSTAAKSHFGLEPNLSWHLGPLQPIFRTPYACNDETTLWTLTVLDF
jgi:hypothetical protein